MALRSLKSLKWIRQALVVAGLVLIGHQSALIPHALCQSLEEANGESVEVATDTSWDSQEDHNAHCDHDAGLAATDHNHHHDHCEHQLPDLRQSDPSKILIASTPAFWTVPMAAIIREPAITLARTSRNRTFVSATEQFVQHVRLLS